MAAPEKIGLENQGLAAQGLAAQGLAAQGLAAQGLQPAGMLRISKGQQERYVWPVHLSGWLALGWRVAGAEAPSIGIDLADPPAPITPAADEPLGQDAATPAATPAATRGRGKRGRRRKETEEALSAPPADTGISTATGISGASDVSASDSDGPGPDPTEPVLDAEHPTAASEKPDLKPDPAPDPGPDPAAAAADATADGELSLMALPDDLFDDEPLI